MTFVPRLNYLAFLLDPDNWGWASDDIPMRLWEHIEYTLITVSISAAIALPIGMLIGHTNRGAFLAINIGNAGRSLPTFGLLALMVTMVGTGLLPVLVALVVLAIPPILASTYAGIRSVDRSAVDAAVGMGMRPTQVLFRVEVPMALPLISSGVRSALLQVCATATVAAYVGLGGLGRYLVDGLSVNEYDQVFAGALMVAALAIFFDLVGAGVERLIVSPGIRATTSRSTRTGRAPRGARSEPDRPTPQLTSHDQHATTADSAR
jgi:osmoprotectant transport system permease protein